jgi:hypothetical protein
MEANSYKVLALFNLNPTLPPPINGVLPSKRVISTTTRITVFELPKLFSEDFSRSRFEPHLYVLVLPVPIWNLIHILSRRILPFRFLNHL